MKHNLFYLKTQFMPCFKRCLLQLQSQSFNTM